MVKNTKTEIISAIVSGDVKKLGELTSDAEWSDKKMMKAALYYLCDNGRINHKYKLEPPLAKSDWEEIIEAGLILHAQKGAASLSDVTLYKICEVIECIDALTAEDKLDLLKPYIQS